MDWKAERRRVWILAVARAFTITLAVITLVALGAAINQIAHAHADVLGPGIALDLRGTPAPLVVPCEHRGEAHAAQQHTTRDADSRWHVEHGQLPTCNLAQKDDRDDHQDNHDDDKLIPGHRDHEGFHCYHLLHCG